MVMDNDAVCRKNLQAIGRIDPETHEWLLNSTEDPAILSKRNMIVIKDNGQRCSYYEEDPSISSEKEIIESMDLSSGNLTCLIGMGLGYTAKAILETMEKGHILMVVEPNPHIVHLALKGNDFSGYILSGELFVLGSEKKGIQSRLMQLIGGGYAHKNVHIIPDPRGVAIFPHYEDLINDIRIAFNHVTDQISGKSKAAKFFIRNELDNLIQTALSPGVEILKERFGKRPILIIGAGPSLEQSIEWIEGLRKEMILMAFSGSWRFLLSRGIKPHLLVASDKNIEGVATLKHSKHAQDVPLVYSSRIHPDFLKEYTGPRFVVPDSGPLGAWLCPYLNKSVVLPTGVNVACFALEVATFLEGDPIAFTGMDLAVSEYTHTEGHPYSRKIEDHPGILSVPGLGGKTVKSLQQFCTIREELQSQIGKIGKSVINTTAYGAKIDGTRELPIRELHETLPPMAPIRERKIELLPILSQVQMIQLISEFKTFLNEAKDSLKDCTKGLEVSKKLEKSFGRDAKYEEDLRHRLNLRTANVEKIMSRHPFLKLFMGEILYESKVANAKIAWESDERATFRLELEKNKKALEWFRRDMTALITLIELRVKELKELDDTLTSLKEDQSELAIVRFAFFLFKQGLYPEAVCQMKKALSIREDFYDALFLLGKIRTQEGLFIEAKSCIEKAIEIKGESNEATQEQIEIENRIKELVKEKKEAINSHDNISAELLSKELRRVDN